MITKVPCMGVKKFVRKTSNMIVHMKVSNKQLNDL
jgi:hypothetical protein